MEDNIMIYTNREVVDLKNGALAATSGIKIIKLGAENTHINPWKIPAGVYPQAWIDNMIEMFYIANGFTNKKALANIIYSLYTEAGVFELDYETKGVPISTLSENVNFESIWESIKAQGYTKINENHNPDCVAELINEKSEDYQNVMLFGGKDGICIDEFLKYETVIFDFSILCDDLKNFMREFVIMSIYNILQSRKIVNPTERYSYKLISKGAKK